MLKIRNALYVATIITFINLGGAFASPPEKVIKMNNAGVIQLNKKNYEQAVKLLTEALEIAPDYKIALENLAIAYNNWGLKLQSKPFKALSRFQMAILFDPANSTTIKNYLGMMPCFGRKANKFQDHIAMAERAIRDKNYIGAYIGYSAALSVEDNPEAQKKLSVVVDTIADSTRYSDLEKSHIHPDKLTLRFSQAISGTSTEDDVEVSLEEEKSIEDYGKVLKMVR